MGLVAYPDPRVSALLLIAVVVGPAGLDLLPQAREQWEPIATGVALTMVGFLLGRESERHRVHEHGRRVFAIAVLAALATGAVTAGGLLVVGVGVPLALALGGIAAATAPAATLTHPRTNLRRRGHRNTHRHVRLARVRMVAGAAGYAVRRRWSPW